MRHNKPLLSRPSGRPPTVYVTSDADGTIVRVYTTIDLAFKHTPTNGFVSPITLGILRKFLGHDEIVKEFLKTYDEGRWC